MKSLPTYLSLFILLLALGACGSDSNSTGPDPDPDPDPTTGSVEVMVTTGGSDIDENGYTISVDGGEGESVESNGTITISDLEQGSHDLRISGVADNCAVDGNISRSITIAAGGTVAVEYEVTCGDLAGAEPIINRIVFTTDRDRGGADLFIMNPDGTGQTSLFTGGNDDIRLPSISPDGTRIVYEEEADIWVVRADGTIPKQLTDGTNDTRPSWSPDGSQIVFSSFRDGNHEIYIMNADGTGQTNLTNDPGSRDLSPSFSPDGQRIAFDSTGEIITMNVDGTDRQNVSNNTVVDEHPQYSPDGTQIAFISDRDASTNRIINVFTINIDGTNEQQITNDGADKERVGWSPDGSQLVFETRGGALDIFVINADGTNTVRLTDNEGSDRFPNWSPLQ